MERTEERRLASGWVETLAEDTSANSDSRAERPQKSESDRPGRPKSSSDSSLNTTVCRDVKMATVVSKIFISPSKMGFLTNIAPVAGYVAQRSYAIRPAEIPTAK